MCVGSHPDALRTALAAGVAAARKDRATLAALLDATSLTGGATCHQPLADASTSLAVGLRAADASVRTAATLQLVEQLEGENVSEGRGRGWGRGGGRRGEGEGEGDGDAAVGGAAGGGECE